MKDEIIRLGKEGYSYSQIQKELGCSKGTISYHLGAGQKEKSSERTRSRRGVVVAYIQEYKQSRPCADCRENYPYWVMDFDHIGDKKFTIGEFRKKVISLETIKQEIEKCDVVCSNCHRNRTQYRSVTSGANTLDVSQHYL